MLYTSPILLPLSLLPRVSVVNYPESAMLTKDVMKWVSRKQKMHSHVIIWSSFQSEKSEMYFRGQFVKGWRDGLVMKRA